MFDLKELAIRDDDEIGRILEWRALRFTENTAELPNTAFISNDVFNRLNLQYSNGRWSSPVPQGHTTLIWQSSLGTISFRVLPNLKKFLFVGTATYYEKLETEIGIPMELWGDAYRKKIDKDFEEIVLGVEC